MTSSVREDDESIASVSSPPPPRRPLGDFSVVQSDNRDRKRQHVAMDDSVREGIRFYISNGKGPKRGISCGTPWTGCVCVAGRVAGVESNCGTDLIDGVDRKPNIF